jgi:trans-aconitate methyltransferase
LAEPDKGQVWDPERYARNARFVADLGVPLLDLLQLGPGRRVLDLGCGDGALTEMIASTGAIVVGVDASAEQVQAAVARGVDARVMDGAALTFSGNFDAILSNAALHWMRDADAVIHGMWRALRPGGVVVAEMGGYGNVATVHTALYAALARRGIDASDRDPWYFPHPVAYRAKLAEAGFQVRQIDLIDRPTTLPGDVGDWLETFAGHYLVGFDAGSRAQLIDEVRAAIAPTLKRPDGVWVVDYVRLRFVADKPRETP